MSKGHKIKYLSAAEMFAEKQYQPEGKNRYWVVFECKNGMISTWTDYADTPDEFITDLLNQRGSYIAKFIELQQEVNGWPAVENLKISVAKYAPMLIAAESSGKDSEIAEVAKKTFRRECDFQSVLRAHIEQLDPDLKIIDGGKERETDAGQIDITAMDANGNIVVIELKREIASPEAIAQVLAYMEAVTESDHRTVRGMLVAADFDKWVVLAARRISDLQLKKYSFQVKEYSFQFAFESVQ